MDGDEPLVELEGQQLAIYRAIAEQDETLASWYYGARVALATRGNPEDLVHAAHSISELMNSLHTVAEIPAKREEGRLGDKFDAMAAKWEKGKQTPSASATGDGRGRLTMQLGVLSQPLTMQLNGSGRTGTRWKETYRSTIRGLDVSQRALPSWIEEKFVELWDQLRTYFIDVCHHRLATDADEFAGALDTFERFVLDRLKPRTFAEQQTLDDLIREATISRAVTSAGMRLSRSSARLKMVRGERDFTLEERANAWIVREGRRPELDNHKALGQVAPVDRGPHRWGFAGLLVDAITIRRRDESKITVGGCGRRQRYRSLLLVEAWTRVVIDPSQGIDVSRLKRGRDATWLGVFGDHDIPPLGVDGIDCVERQQAPMPKNDPVSTDREPLFARLRIIDQLDDQPDPSAAGVEYRVTGRRAK
jgi:hypothetical protein